MQEAWLKGFKDREKRKKEILSYRNAFEELSKVIEQLIPDEVTVDYTQAGWEGQMADNIGERRAFRRILKLIKVDD